MTDISKRLAEPFDPALVSWRLGPTNREKTKGMALAYVDSRDVMRRLDEVCGPENWQDEYPWSDGKRVVCRIGIKIGDEWIWKSDGAGDTDTEGEKGALSDAYKRAAVKWGVGRYLYDVESPWVPIEQRGNSYFIPESEKSKLAALLRRQFGVPSSEIPRVTQTATPMGSAPQANGAAPPIDPDRRATAVGIKDRLKTALTNAKTPKIVDEIVSINSDDLKLVKDVQPSLYDGLMTLASQRKAEMLGGMG